MAFGGNGLDLPHPTNLSDDRSLARWAGQLRVAVEHSRDAFTLFDVARGAVAAFGIIGSAVPASSDPAAFLQNVGSRWSSEQQGTVDRVFRDLRTAEAGSLKERPLFNLSARRYVANWVVGVAAVRLLVLYAWRSSNSQAEREEARRGLQDVEAALLAVLRFAGGDPAIFGGNF